MKTSGGGSCAWIHVRPASFLGCRLPRIVPLNRGDEAPSEGEGRVGLRPDDHKDGGQKYHGGNSKHDSAQIVLPLTWTLLLQYNIISRVSFRGFPNPEVDSLQWLFLKGLGLRSRWGRPRLGRSVRNSSSHRPRPSKPLRGFVASLPARHSRTSSMAGSPSWTDGFSGIAREAAIQTWRPGGGYGQTDVSGLTSSEAASLSRLGRQGGLFHGGADAFSPLRA